MMTAQNYTQLRGEMKYNESMAKHTSWRVGGPAEKFYTPADIDDLSCLLQSLPVDEPVFWLGLGSNLLVRDGGIKGTVIAQKGSLAELDVIDGTQVRAGVGVSCAKLARFCSKHNLVGGEFFAGIPGLLGGALAMNAGAFGGETWRYVQSVVTINRQGVLFERSPQDYQIAYRSVKGPLSEWFVQATLKFEQGDGVKAAENIRALLDKRGQTQPTGLPSCGSVFRNPPGDFAARLIEDCGLKGVMRGEAVVSEKHANFIINTGHAKASDIEMLIDFVRQQVKRKHGIDLVTEVKVVGEPN